MCVRIDVFTDRIEHLPIGTFPSTDKNNSVVFFCKGFQMWFAVWDLTADCFIYYQIFVRIRNSVFFHLCPQVICQIAVFFNTHCSLGKKIYRPGDINLPEIIRTGYKNTFIIYLTKQSYYFGMTRFSKNHYLSSALLGSDPGLPYFGLQPFYYRTCGLDNCNIVFFSYYVSFRRLSVSPDKHFAVFQGSEFLMINIC